MITKLLMSIGKALWRIDTRGTKMKKALAVLVLVITSFVILRFVGTGFIERYDVCLSDYSVSEDGLELTFTTVIFSSMGHTRGFRDDGGGVKPHYLTFYSTFGGLNSTFGAKSEFVLMLDENDTEIYFADIGGGYKLVLKKDEKSGLWERP